jgi:hypothetical protein
MRRMTMAVSLIACVALFAATAATAASPHFKRGGTPKCTITPTSDGTNTVCTGTLAGLGGGDIVIDTTVEGTALYQCQNNGGNTAPGQNRVLVGPSTTPTTIDSDAIKNGNLTFATNPAGLEADATVSGSAAGCPGNNWTGVNPALTLTDITLTISQGGTLLFTCTASNPDGLSGTVALTC